MTGTKHQVFIGLGGNVGDVLSNMAKALRFLDSDPEIELMAVSPVYTTPPWGITEQDWFLNACARLKTSLEPKELLSRCIAAEKSLKRIRNKRWGPRTIDIDILLFDDLEIDEDQLTVPHPRMYERQFVLKPLSDLDSSLIVNGKSVADWLILLDEPPIETIDVSEDWVQEFSLPNR